MAFREFGTISTSLGVSIALVLASTPAMAAPPDAAPSDDPTSEVSEPESQPVPPAPSGDAAKAAILPLAVEGELSDEDRASLTEQLVDGLKRGSFAVVPPEQVLAAESSADKCDKERCFKKVASATGSTHVVRAVVTVQDRDYAIKVSVLDGLDGAVLATTQESCEICGVADVGGIVSTAAATLRTKLDALASGPSTLVLASDPEGATVTMDGEIVGVTPIDRPVLPGKHVIRVSKEGYIGIEREVTFVEGVQEKIEFKLDKLPNRLPTRPWGFASLGIGLAGLGAGIGLMVASSVNVAPQFQPDCSGGNKDTSGECRYLWDFRWAAFGIGLAGAALTTLGIAILLSTSPKRAKKERKKATARVGIGAGSMVLHGRF